MRSTAHLGLAIAFDDHTGQGTSEETENGGRQWCASTGQQFHVAAELLSELLEHDLVHQRVSLVDEAVDLSLLDRQCFTEKDALEAALSHLGHHRIVDPVHQSGHQDQQGRLQHLHVSRDRLDVARKEADLRPAHQQRGLHTQLETVRHRQQRKKDELANIGVAVLAKQSTKVRQK